MRLGASFTRARHLLQSAVPRNSGLFGVSFPDNAHTRSRFLEAVGEDIYLVKDSSAAVITRSGVIRVGWNYLDLDYGPYSAFRNMPVFSRSKTAMPRVVSLWTHDWSTYYHWLIDVAPKIVRSNWLGLYQFPFEPYATQRFRPPSLPVARRGLAEFLVTYRKLRGRYFHKPWLPNNPSRG